jgi:hypothetical protein
MGLNQSLFFRGKGFANCNTYPYSEETIFLCRNGNAKNTRVAWHHNAMMTSSQRLTFGQWFKQKALYTSLLNMGRRGVGRLRTEMFFRLTYYASLAALGALSYLSEDTLLLQMVAPMLLLLIWMIVQYALYFQARQEALASAQEGDRYAREVAGTPGAARGVGWQRQAEKHATDYYASLGSNALGNVRATAGASDGGNQVSVTVTGHMISIIFGWPLPAVSETSKGPVECFRVNGQC